MIDGTLWSTAWQQPGVAEGQLRLVEVELSAWREGTSHPAFDALCELLSRCGKGESILEVGCGCGYYAEVITLGWRPTKFTGIDISEHAIWLAYENYGGDDRVFTVGDASRLPYQDGKFDCVILGSILGHVADWELVLSEAARVSSRYLILHRVQCHDMATAGGQKTIARTKTAYGVEMAERSFDEESLLKTAAEIIGGRLIGEPIVWSRSLNGWQMSCMFEKQ